jgi:hypothetical protein
LKCGWTYANIICCAIRSIPTLRLTIILYHTKKKKLKSSVQKGKAVYLSLAEDATEKVGETLLLFQERLKI